MRSDPAVGRESFKFSQMPLYYQLSGIDKLYVVYSVLHNWIYIFVSISILCMYNIMSGFCEPVKMVVCKYCTYIQYTLYTFISFYDYFGIIQSLFVFIYSPVSSLAKMEFTFHITLRYFFINPASKLNIQK